MSIKRFLGIITIVIIVIGVGVQAAIQIHSFSDIAMPFKMTSLNLYLGGLVQPNGGDDVPGPGWPGPG
ncbi:MAG: hypothetical protein JSV51_07820 [Candidatus Bathyarchaeota archaeon]|nr:MAG: hypothetical protein JSV51_07820 [Candidatus Bathyarchaeota archaeon]